MNNFSTPIIPSKPQFYGVGKVLDRRAICVYSALGFFLGIDTFWVDKKILPVASDCEIENGKFVSSKPYFNWHYNPRNITLSQATEEFTDLFEEIVQEQTGDKRVILPLSGGLDSRTQAAALKNTGARVNAFSYAFRGGHDETEYSGKIAEVQNFPFQRGEIEPGYLWNVIDDLAQINGCYSEFTHPRQMAFVDRYAEMGDVFSLGHWGDVLFDGMGVPNDLSFDEQTKVLLKKIVKKSGMELGSVLWKAWGLEGNFEEYLFERIKALHAAIDIPNNANARVRAFKSMYWAPRWTSVNLSVFESAREISLPYYDNRMCEFVCTVPEEHLAGRKIQIEYLKRRAPKLAEITWQAQRPFNLYNYQWNKKLWNLPYQVYNRTKRAVNSKSYIQRNWELQFLGGENDKQLKARLFDEPKFSDWVPGNIVRDFYNKFKTENAVRYSHSVSMLLTLSLFAKHFKEKINTNISYNRFREQDCKTAGTV